jgi:hypothetical protein
LRREEDSSRGADWGGGLKKKWNNSTSNAGKGREGGSRCADFGGGVKKKWNNSTSNASKVREDGSRCADYIIYDMYVCL